VRELVVRERLEALARDAAERLRELVRSGEEIPFAVAGPGDGSPFAQYVPQTDRFVREHWAELAELDAFGEACAAFGTNSLAAPYLDSLGEPVPPSEDRCCEAAAIAFLTKLWEGSADFSIDDERIAAALDEIDGRVGASESDAEIVAPLVGFQMPAKRLALATATIVRADLVAVPDEIRRSEGTMRSGFEPQFLAIVQGSTPPPGDASADDNAGGANAPGTALRELVATLRLFKAGGAGLGPYAWAHTPGDRWRRLATGSAPPRRGGYRLTEQELGDLAALSRAIASRSTPFGGALARAVSRFEAGLERPTMLEALSDYILTLRHLFDGGGAADVSVPMRVAAMSAEPSQRPGVKAQVERALQLEFTLMRGEPPVGGDGEPPLELVAAIEEHARTMLRALARGDLGVDPRAAADEALLADGLSVGEGAEDVRGETAEWEAIQPQPHPATDPVAPGREAEDATGIDADEATGIDSDLQETPDEQPTRVLMGIETDAQHAPPAAGDADAGPSDWLSEVDSRGDTLDWPERPEALKLLDRRPAERERARKRVRHLFPRPETTEWRVAELQYDRRRRTRV
jgi:hypothetical protein